MAQNDIMGKLSGRTLARNTKMGDESFRISSRSSPCIYRLRFLFLACS